MRIVIIGTSRMARVTAGVLLEAGQDVVVVDRDRARLDALGEALDCGLLQGDGTSPATLREAGGEQPDVLLVLTEHDQTNILAALLGRSVGFGRVIPQIIEPDLNALCRELGIEDTISPHETMGRHLASTVLGEATMSVSALDERGARLMAIVVHADGPRRLADLDLPDRARVVCVLEEEGFVLPPPDAELAVDSRVVVVTDDDGLATLKRRYRRGGREA